MTIKLAEQQKRDSLKASEVHIQIIERHGEQLLVIKEQRSRDNQKEYVVEIPAALLPELKRAVEVMAQGSGSVAENVAAADKPAGASINNASTNEAANEASTGEDGNAAASVAFAHESEEEFARILDFYHIRWEYEPRTFVLEHDAAGNVLKCFTPDFYLPDHDLFIEITTLKQSLVTKKNRKVRLLKELYPQVNIKLLYASDYAKLLEKFAASRFRETAEAATNNG